MRSYYEHSKIDAPFDPVKSYGMLLERDEWLSLPIQWSIKEKQSTRDIFQCDSLIVNNDGGIVPRVNEQEGNAPPLLWLSYGVPGSIATNIRDNEYICSPYSAPPVQFSAYNRSYQIVGISYFHVYATPYRCRWRWLRGLLVPSYILMPWLNCQWSRHLDAVVKYGNSWYLMDDDTRWRIDVHDSQGRSIVDPHRVAATVMNNYPGLPQTIVYTQAQKDEVAPPTDAPVFPMDTLVLCRDTPRPLKRACMGLFLAPLVDGVYSFPLVTLFCRAAGRILPLASNVRKHAFSCGLLGGSIIAAVSFIVQLQHIKPLFKKRIEYKREDAPLTCSLSGPRAPLFTGLNCF